MLKKRAGKGKFVLKLAACGGKTGDALGGLHRKKAQTKQQKNKRGRQARKLLNEMEPRTCRERPIVESRDLPFEKIGGQAETQLI